MARRGAGRVPERWTDYTPLGHRLPGTRFVAFKVPLAERFNSNLLPEERFSPQDLLRKVRERKEELGLIIDLTYTMRYYGRQDLPPTLLYSKILTVGHEIPSRKIILRFHSLVRRFLADNGDNDKLIGVHCTHGLNRTGYLVCRYLIDVEGMEPNAAIDLFNKSRGHPMERANYIQDLQRGALSTEPGSAKEKRRPEGQHQGLEQLEQKQLEQKQLEQKQLEQKQLERRQKKKQKKLELRQKKKQNYLEQRQQNFLEQNHSEQNFLEQRQQNFLEQRQRKKKRKKKKKLEQRQQNHLEQRQQDFLEQNHADQNFLEQRQNFLEQRQKNHLEQRQQNHPEQRQQDFLGQNFLGQNSLEPCPARKRWCWRRKPKVGQQKMS